ncbi:MAG: hypothetical protein MH472_10370, partial [Bacteroidia bacterium]|nr:hypothetical protein [Bacteroidia bacterium]
TQNIDPNNQSLSSNVYSSTAKLRVGDNIEIRVRSGMIIKGVVTKNMVSSIKLKTEDSELTIPKSDIKQLVNLRELKNDLEILNMNSNPESSNFSRYFFAPSAIKNKSGTFVYDNSYLFVNSLTYSPTDFLSITGSAEIITLLAAQPMYMIAPHMGFKFADGFYIGGGFMHFNMINEDIKLNVLFGTVTVGDQNRNATLNIGRGTQANSDYSINLSGFLRVSKNFGIITENWFSPALNFIDEDVPLLGVGGRLMSKNVNFDFALITFIPYIGFSVRF